jgi:uncharacterized protein
MLVYESIKKQFIEDVEKDKIVDEIHAKYKQYFGKSNNAQIRSWKNSMEYMYKVLNTTDIPEDSGIAIEFNIPSTSKRIDFLISGKDSNNISGIIIIELKQWDSCNIVDEKDGIVKTYVGGGIREVEHPSYQAWSYATLIEDFNLAIQENNIKVYPCAYLHNYKIETGDPILHPIYTEYLNQAPVFGNGDVFKLREFINKYIKYGDRNLLYIIENGKISPSKRLQDSLVKMLSGNKEFVLIDDQKVVYEHAKYLGVKSKKDEKKRVIIIEGGPGTGKTILAINLLSYFINKKLVANYVTKNSAPREVFYNKLMEKYKAPFIKNLFKGSGSYVDSNANEIDVLIVDEAHRLNEKSGLFKNKGINQISEIINASKLSIFFVDENQKVTLSDIGDIETINKYSKIYNAEISLMKLESQFRCNGSDGYLSWLDDILDIKQTANFDGFDLNFDFKVVDTPNELNQLIVEKNKKNNKSRLVAGYCWNWISTGKDKTDIHDIVIPEYQFSMSWNLGNTKTWAIDKESVNEIGCIHTTQGLEFDYVGVIIGPDMIYNGGKIITDFTKRAKTDQSLRGINKIFAENPKLGKSIADQIIKNTYRTLMTRGQKGCYIYCCNKELQQYFKEKIKLFKT